MNDAGEPPNPYAPPSEAPEPVLAQLAEAPAQPATPWGFWLTVLFSAIVLIVFVAIQTAVVVVFLFAEMGPGLAVGPREPEDFVVSGLLLSVATLLSTPVAALCCLALAALRRRMPLRQYLAFRPVSWRALLGWCGAVVLFMLAADGATYLFHREVVPSQMLDAYRTAGVLPLLWLALVVAAPLFEETFFRGFVYQGLRHSWPGPVGAIVITAAVWAVIHLQYDAYQVSVIFVGGLLLGTARLKTDSVYPCMAMHALWNLIATVETALLVGG